MSNLKTLNSWKGFCPVCAADRKNSNKCKQDRDTGLISASQPVQTTKLAMSRTASDFSVMLMAGDCGSPLINGPISRLRR